VDRTLTIWMLPARHGDALLVTWDAPSGPHHLMIDGGPAPAYDAVRTALSEVPDLHLDLLVVTHVDADHIEGALLLANDAGLDVGIDEVWFNGPAQLSDELSAAQGEMLAALLGARDIPLNNSFRGGPLMVPDDDAPLLERTLAGGLRLTVLAPDRAALVKLADAWAPTLEDEALNFESPAEALAALRGRLSLNPDNTFLGEPGVPPDVVDLATVVVAPDVSVPNASSIVLLAEYAGNAVLLAGDATPPVLLRGIRTLLQQRGLDRLELAAFKVPHHGSVRNVTAELLRISPADHYLFSSDGSRFGHPDPGGVARCLEYGKAGAELVFNYSTPQTLQWEAPDRLAGATVRLPPARTDGIRVVLPPRGPEATT
jgi:beta-lactamase superfamily II metal-dependent hydrolase